MRQSEVEVSAELRSTAVDSILAALNARYVYPEVAKEMEAHIRRQASNGAYDNISTLEAFLSALQRDLRDVCGDRHLFLDIEPSPTQETVGSGSEEAVLVNRADIDRLHNFGFEKVTCLPGNVGYLKINEFLDPAVAGPTAVASMNFLGGVDALIVDLRANGGGWGEMVQLISSYFFSEPTHLHTIYIRPEDATIQSWSYAFVEGPRLDKIPIYVLVSRRTASAAEEFADNLKNLKRAVVVGETTKGAAHPIEVHSIADLGIRIQLPFARSISPITGENWEGKGVTPDVAVPAHSALDVAHRAALDTLATSATDEGGRFRRQWALRELNAGQPTVEAEAVNGSDYIGSYGPRRILMGDGQLEYVYDSEGTPKYPLVHMGDDWFKSDLLPHYHLRFVRNDTGEVTGLVELRDNGRSTTHDRTGG